MRFKVGFYWEFFLVNIILERFFLGMSLGEMGFKVDFVREMGVIYIIYIRGVWGVGGGVSFVVDFFCKYGVVVVIVKGLFFIVGG